MKSCIGCKHLYRVIDRCGAQDGPYVRLVNQYTGHVRYVSQSKHGDMRPTVQYMRTEGDCGEEAKLFKAAWWYRCFKWLFS